MARSERPIAPPRRSSNGTAIWTPSSTKRMARTRTSTTTSSISPPRPPSANRRHNEGMPEAAVDPGSGAEFDLGLAVVIDDGRCSARDTACASRSDQQHQNGGPPETGSDLHGVGNETQATRIPRFRSIRSPTLGVSTYAVGFGLSAGRNSNLRRSGNQRRWTLNAGQG